jgi:chromosome segregation ATPase
MVDRELQAEEKNLEASVAFLRSENQREAALLSKLLAKKKAAETGARAAEKKALTAVARLDDLKAAHDTEKAARAALRGSQSSERALHAEELNQLKTDHQQAQGEIANLHEVIATLEAKKTDLESTVETLQANINAKAELAQGFVELTREIATLEDRRDSLLSDISRITEEGEATKRTTATDLATLESSAASARAELAEAESRKKLIDDECQRKSADLLIAIERIEAEYQKAFPGLRLLLI